MSTKNKNNGSETSGELVKNPAGVGNLAIQAQQTAAMTSKDQLKALEASMGVGAEDIEVIVAGKLPFWPAFAGAILVGTIQARREVPTEFGNAGLYTVRVENQKCLAATLDGEVFELDPGDLITVLERIVLQELRARMGQKVGILCVGKTKGSGNAYWDYKVLGAKRTADQVQASSMQALASLQMKQLEAKNSTAE